MSERERLLSRVLQSVSRHQVSNDRAWSAVLNDKIRQVGELEHVYREILRLCAESDTGTVQVEDIYTIMQGIRQ